MKYTFKEILNTEIYENTRVMFVLGKYTWFNNMVCDTLKYTCINEEDTVADAIGVEEEFGIEDINSDNALSNSVDFNTFMDVIGVSSINGKWFCRVDFSMLNKKQQEKLFTYIKDPSSNGVLIITSTDWMQYKEILRNKVLSISKVSHIIQLSFPSKPILKNIVAQSFDEKGINIDSNAVDFFVMRMSSAYDKYEDEINNIVDVHGTKPLDLKTIKVYMKGIENYVIDDFVLELTKPMVSDKTNSKKVLKMMIALEDEFGAKSVVLQTIKKVNECIDYRLLINQGYIPIGINYFFNDIINKLPNKEKYEKVNEWTFRKKAELASKTSLRDWEYMRLILNKALENQRISDNEMDKKCQKALYELATRSVLTPDRINNIIGIENTIEKDLEKINNIVYDEESLEKIEKDKELAKIG